MSTDVKITTAGKIKPGNYIIIDDAPYRVVSVDKSKAGKHGSAKARIVAINVFDGSKKTITVPTDEKIRVPIIKKGNAFVVSINEGENTAQLMDVETNEIFDALMPEDESIRSSIAPGVTVEYRDLLGRKMIVRVHSERVFKNRTSRISDNASATWAIVSGKISSSSFSFLNGVGALRVTRGLSLGF